MKEEEEEEGEAAKSSPGACDLQLCSASFESAAVGLMVFVFQGQRRVMKRRHPQLKRRRRKIKRRTQLIRFGLLGSFDFRSDVRIKLNFRLLSERVRKAGPGGEGGSAVYVV